MTRKTTTSSQRRTDDGIDASTKAAWLASFSAWSAPVRDGAENATAHNVACETGETFEKQVADWLRLPLQPVLFFESGVMTQKEAIKQWMSWSMQLIGENVRVLSLYTAASATESTKTDTVIKISLMALNAYQVLAQADTAHAAKKATSTKEQWDLEKAFANLITRILDIHAVASFFPFGLMKKVSDDGRIAELGEKSCAAV